MTRLENPKITIRRAEPDDYEGLTRVTECKGVIAGTQQLPYPSRELWRKRLTEATPDNYTLVAVVDGEIVGNIGLHLNTQRIARRHVGGIGMGVHDDWQGKGVGTALMVAVVDLADNWLNILRLELEVITTNEPALRLYRKFGFENEGTLKMWGFRDGKYVDVYSMARFRPE